MRRFQILSSCNCEMLTETVEAAVRFQAVETLHKVGPGDRRRVPLCGYAAINPSTALHVRNLTDIITLAL